MRGAARDAVYDHVLAGEGVLEGVEGGVVDGFGGDGGVRGDVGDGGCGAGEGEDGVGGGRGEEGGYDGGADVAAGLLG